MIASSVRLEVRQATDGHTPRKSLPCLVSENLAPEKGPPESARAPIPDGRECPWQALSLFAGGGGLDLGFLQQGIRSNIAYDIAQDAVAVYNANLPTEARLADLSRFSPDGKADVLLAGAPCQGFSTAGKRLVDDPRNELLVRVGEIAKATKPRVIVVENVPAAASGALGGHWRALEASVER